MADELNYGNWIRKKRLLFIGLATLGLGASMFLPLGAYFRIAATAMFVVIAISFLIPLYAYVAFSQHGGRVQEKVYDLIIQRLGAVSGNVIDLGSGNGVLAVKLARDNDRAEVVGIDAWGKEWEYSMAVCLRNAETAGVNQRVRFQKGDAARLEFADGSFDAAVSNLTFHEVRSVKDKKLVMQEALRVVKPGGTFAFVDYFYETKHYGPSSELYGFLKGLRLKSYECMPLSRVLTLPAVLRHPRVLGNVGIIYGEK